MRVVAGTLGGRQFNSPPGQATHPMGERVRGALFNTLGDIEGLTVLDSFAGSGAISFEAISRGASTATAIESDRRAQQAIKSNIKALDITTQVRLVSAGAGAWLATTGKTFDIVICDPPYHAPQLSLVSRLADRVKTGGIVVISLPPSIEVPLDEVLYELVTRKDYGDAMLSFYRRRS